MTSIVKIDLDTPLGADGVRKHPSIQLWTAATHGLLPRIQAAMLQRGTHPARAMVLLPYAQLRPLAARL